MNMVQVSANPQQALNTIINQNPTLKNIVSLANSHGTNLEQVFYELAKQKGVNPQDVLNNLK